MIDTETIKQIADLIRDEGANILCNGPTSRHEVSQAFFDLAERMDNWAAMQEHLRAHQP